MTDTATIPSEAERWLERYNAALEIGFTEQEAATFATDGDLAELKKLIAAGCPFGLLLRIVL